MSCVLCLFIGEFNYRLALKSAIPKRRNYNMEKKTMGAFLAALRKANGYTQQEVADKLN